MPIEEHGQHQQHRHRDVGELQRRLRGRRCCTIGPNGITENAVNAQIVEIDRGEEEDDLVRGRGMMSSLKASFRPSARDCSRPNGPTRFGPGRTGIRATTRRSYQTPKQRHDDAEDEDARRP